MIKRLLYLCEGLALLGVDLIPKSTQGSLYFAQHVPPHVAEKEVGREGLGTAFSLEVPLKTIVLLKFGISSLLSLF